MGAENAIKQFSKVLPCFKQDKLYSQNIHQLVQRFLFGIRARAIANNIAEANSA